MGTKAIQFLKDNGIEFTDMGDHLGTYQKITLSDKDMVALGKFWSMPINKSDSGNWIIDGTEVKVY